MPPFNELVEMYVWPVTIVSAIASMAIFAIIVILRLFTDKWKSQKTNRKKEINKQLSIHLVSSLKKPRDILVKQAQDMELIADVASTMLRNLKGDSYQTLKVTLEDIGLVDWLSKKLHSKNIKRRIAAISLCAHWPTDEIKGNLIAQLNHEEPLIRQAAIIALADTKDIHLFPTILAEVKKHQSFSYLMLCDIFQQFGSKINDQLTLAAISEYSTARVKMAALMALDKTGDVTAIKKVALPLCEHKDLALRAMAYQAIANNNIYISEQLLHKGVDDKHWEVRQHMAQCLAAHTPLPVSLIQKLLNDPNWLVGFQSASVLYSSGEIGKQLLQNMAQKNDVVGHRARMILIEMAGAYGMA